MAIYHLNAQIIQRSKGHSTTAAAAYRARCVIEDDRTGKTHDYTRAEGDVLFAGVYAPKDAPAWAKDRQDLWGQVEQAETRVDAQLAREFNIALPHELNDKQKLWLIQDWTRENFVRKGYAADVTIHAPHEYGDERNTHAHVMVPLRQFDGDEFADTKDDSNPVRAALRLQELRESWEKLTNRHLERAGFDERISCQSYKDQGIELEPTVHLGKDAAALERQGIETERGDRQWQAVLENQANAVQRQADAQRAAEEQRAAEMYEEFAGLRPHEQAMRLESMQTAIRQEERQAEIRELTARVEDMQTPVPEPILPPPARSFEEIEAAIIQREKESAEREARDREEAYASWMDERSTAPHPHEIEKERHEAEFEAHEDKFGHDPSSTEANPDHPDLERPALEGISAGFPTPQQERQLANQHRMDLLGADIEGREYSMIPAAMPAAARPADSTRLDEFLDTVGQLESLKHEDRAEKTATAIERVEQFKDSRAFEEQRADSQQPEMEEAYEPPVISISKLRPMARLAVKVLESFTEGAAKLFGVAADMMESLFEPARDKTPAERRAERPPMSAEAAAWIEDTQRVQAVQQHQDTMLDWVIDARRNAEAADREREWRESFGSRKGKDRDGGPER